MALGAADPGDSALADHLSGSPADTWNGPLQSKVVAYVVFRVRHGEFVWTMLAKSLAALLLEIDGDERLSSRVYSVKI